MTEEGKEIIGAVKEMFGVLNDKITSLDNKVTSLESGQQELKNEIREVKQEVSSLKQDVSEVKQKVIKIETTLENETNRNITRLLDGYIQNADRLDRLQPMVEAVEYIKLKTDVIEAVTKVHSYDINYLKKAK